MLTQLPGYVSLYLQIVPGVFLDLHGCRWDRPNTQDIQTSCLFLSSTKRFSIFSFSTNFIMAGNGRWFILLCSKTKSCWSLSRISGLAILSSCNGVRLWSLEAYYSIEIDTFEMYGTVMDEMCSLSTRYSSLSDMRILCLRVSPWETGTI